MLTAGGGGAGVGPAPESSRGGKRPEVRC